MGNTQSATPIYRCACCRKNITGAVSYFDRNNKIYKCLNCYERRCPMSKYDK